MKLKTFKKSSFNDAIKKKLSSSGIYLLMKDSDLVYIGKSKRLGERLYSHINENIKDFDSIAILICEDVLISKETIEAILINIFTPRYNKTVPSLSWSPWRQCEDYQDEFMARVGMKLTEEPTDLSRFIRSNKHLFKQLSEI